VARRPLGPDHVALVLALSLGLLGSLILIGTIVQILHGNPEVTLSDNAGQILIATVSGLTGVLGGYMGYRLGQRDSGEAGKPSPPSPPFMVPVPYDQDAPAIPYDQDAPTEQL
jgi:hypothetical protein